MSFLVPLLASLALLLASGLLLSTLGRRRRQRKRALPASELAALESTVGSGLAAVVADTVQLRQRVEDVAASAREMLTVERHLGSTARRPLWRQIEDANFGHELDGLRRATSAWLRRFEALDASERQVIERLDLHIEPLRTLVFDTNEDEALRWHDDFPAPERPRDRLGELHEVLAHLDGMASCLRRVAAEISGYRGGGYR
jgi:hypothetical protein